MVKFEVVFFGQDANASIVAETVETRRVQVRSVSRRTV